MRFSIKISTFFVLSALIISPAFADSTENKCMKLYLNNPPEVNIVYNYGRLKFDNSKNSTELGEIYKAVNSGKTSPNIHGLTDLEPSITTGIILTASLIDGENYCFYPQKINIKMWYNPTIYVVNSLEPGSCRFNTTIRHEQTHLDLAHHALYVLAKSLRNSVPEILSEVSPVVADSSFDGEKITKEMTDAYHEKIKVYFDEFKKSTEKYNSIIDSPENYIFETGLCLNK